ncbi:MAG TPA: HI1506-related protein [Azospirillum sp.]|nr:HI1506-related protein [Azospirillum sp.]
MAQHLRIVSKRAGFRRAGISHPDQPVFHRLSDFTAAQEAALKAEPMLIVDEMDPPDAVPAAGEGQGRRRGG